jgi:hypothetical protein
MISGDRCASLPAAYGSTIPASSGSSAMPVRIGSTT